MSADHRAVAARRRPPSTAAGALALALVAIAPAAGATEPVAKDSAEGEARLDPDSVGVPAFGVVFEGGSETRKLTGRAALRYDAFALDVSLAGADRDTSGRSGLFDSLDVGPTGTLTAGLTWTSFRVADQESVFDQLEVLCDEQERELAGKLGAALEEDGDVTVAVARATVANEDVVAAEARVTKQRKATDDAQAALVAAQQTERELLDAARAAARSAGAAPPPAPPARDAKETKAASEADAARVRALVAAIDAQAASTSVAQRAIDAARAEARLAVAEEALGPVRAAKREADAALTKEKSRVGEDFTMSSCAASKLSPERQARIDWPVSPTYIASLRGAFGTQSTEYIDPFDGATHTDAVHPWRASVGAGVFVRPTLLVATTLSYGRTRAVGSARLVCEDTPIGARTADPPVYGCAEKSVGVPAWSQGTAIRGEIRQHIAKGFAANPSFTYAWSGPEEPPFAADQGAWKAELPVYVQLGLGSGDDKALVFGAAYTHKQTWGLGDANEVENDASLFLGGAFDIGQL